MIQRGRQLDQFGNEPLNGTSPTPKYLGVLLAAVLVALGVLAYLYYERTKPVAKIDLPGVSGEITKEGVDIEVGKPKN